jgi:chromosome partitioning protein
VLICCANQKGGVGKTTTAVNLAVCLSRQAAGRVLAVDCDPQATMTRQLGIDVRTTVLTLVDVLAGRVGAGDAVVPDVVAGVDVIAGARELSGVEMALVGEIGRERFLAEALAPLLDGYSTVVLDTPPNLGLLTVNALVSADIVLVPVSCEDEASVQGLVELRGTLSKLRRLRDSEPELLTILTRWAAARVMSQVIEVSLDELGFPVVAKVPSRAAVGQAGAEHVPLAITAPDGCVALAYERLADQLAAAHRPELVVIRS